MATTKTHSLNYGGAREGAGRKPADFVPSQDRQDYDAARARNESVKADLNELDLKVKSGEFVARVEVREAAATALATLAQSLRSVPDNLERKLGLAPEVAAEVGALIDAALADVAFAFEEMHEGAKQAERTDDLL